MKTRSIKQPTILVIVGISGDLSRRKLLPSLIQISKYGILPEKFRIIGVSTGEVKHADIFPSNDTSGLQDRTEIMNNMDLTEEKSCKDLTIRLEEVEKEFGTSAQRLFYLAVPPQVIPDLVESMAKAHLLKRDDSKLLLEKPFGIDLDSALERVEQLRDHCKEEQIYRIDHYMAKEMAQNLIVFRNGNSLIKRTWNRDFIESIEIIASEKIGIEGRAAFYEQTGALRDFVQNHMLQMAALVLMDLPSSIHDWQDVPALRLRALNALEPPRRIAERVHRGQYEGYREEVDNPDSNVETFVSLTLYSSDWHWQGVPITLTTGKALDRKCTEIHIKYRQEDALNANELVMHVQPNEGVTLQLWVKEPGHENELLELPLRVSYEHHFAQLPDAYERVLADAMLSNRALFTTSDETIAAWRILEPIQKAWAASDDDLFFYKKGENPKEMAKTYDLPMTHIAAHSHHQPHLLRH